MPLVRLHSQDVIVLKAILNVLIQGYTRKNVEAAMNVSISEQSQFVLSHGYSNSRKGC